MDEVIIYAALFDDYHDIRPIPKQTIPTRNILYTDKHRVVDGWEVKVVNRKFSSGRLENRWYKCMIPCSDDADVTIYVDSNLQLSPTFAEQYLGYLKGNDVALFQHPSSNNLMDEFEAASKLPKYNKDNMQKLMEYLRARTALEFWKVYACTTIARVDISRKVRWNWFEMNLISDMDQLSFDYCHIDLSVAPIKDKNFMFNDMYQVVAWKPE